MSEKIDIIRRWKAAVHYKNQTHSLKGEGTLGTCKDGLLLVFRINMHLVVSRITIQKIIEALAY